MLLSLQSFNCQLFVVKLHTDASSQKLFHRLAGESSFFMTVSHSGIGWCGSSLSVELHRKLLFLRGVTGR